MYFEASLDGTTWYALFGTPSNGGSAVGSAAGPGLWIVSVAGLALVRCALRGTVTGGITVIGLGTSAGY